MHPDVIVLGLGAMGSATLLQLARRGVRVLGIDRHHPPHDHGSSHGETRITRQAIGEGADYTPLALRSHAVWRELEAETGERLLLTCGFLGIDGADGATLFHGKPGFLGRTREVAQRYGILHEVLSPEEVRRRFPAFRTTDSDQCYYEPGGGLVFPERCVAAQLTVARRLGAVVRTGETVLSVTPTASGVTVRTDRDTHHAGQAVLATGGWTADLEPRAMRAFRLLRQVLHWYPASDPDIWSADRCPTFIWTHGPTPEDSFYGFPMVPGTPTAGVKVATEQYAAAAASPDAIDREPDPAESAAMHAAHVAPFLAGVGPVARRAAVCFYTSAPDGDFAIGPVGDTANVTLVSACSGHGFKHAPGVGAMVADALLAGVAIPPAFSPARPALRG